MFDEFKARHPDTSPDVLAAIWTYAGGDFELAERIHGEPLYSEETAIESLLQPCGGAPQEWGGEPWPWW